MAADAVAESPSEAAKRTVLWDGLFSRLMDTFTGGVVLAALALQVGADQLTIGILASLPFFAQVAQWPTVGLLLRVQDRRRVVVASSAIARSLLVVIGVFLLVEPSALTPQLLLGFVAALSILAVVSTAAWNWWMRDVIPRRELGRYFGRRAQVTTFVAAGGLLAAGFFLQWAGDRGRTDDGYAALYLVGAAAGFASLYSLWATPHPAPRVRRTGRGAMRLVLGCLSDRQNRRLLVGLALLGSSLAAALPFTAVFLLGTLDYGFVAVTVLAFVSQLAYVGSLRGWGHLGDKFGHGAVLTISVGLLVAALVGWGLSSIPSGATLFALFLVLHFVTGFALGGIELAGGNILLKTAPEENAPAYLAAMAVTRALAAGVAVVLAGIAWQVLGTRPILLRIPFSDLAWTLHGFHVLAAGSVVVGLAALVVLARVREEGGAPVTEVARAMRREVQVISSVAGIRAFVHVVSYVVEFLAERKPARTRPDTRDAGRERGAPDRPRADEPG